MYSYELLEKDCYYIVQLKENDPLTLVQVRVMADTCMYVLKYNETTEMQWVKKSDFIFDIIECLTDEVAQQWLNVYNSSEDASYYEGDEE